MRKEENAALTSSAHPALRTPHSAFHISLMPAAPVITPEAEEFFGPGIAVEIGKIPRELKKLWQENQGVATRASRLNLSTLR